MRLTDEIEQKLKQTFEVDGSTVHVLEVSVSKVQPGYNCTFKLIPKPAEEKES